VGQLVEDALVPDQNENTIGVIITEVMRVLAIFPLVASILHATVILGLDTKEGFVLCADNRISFEQMHTHRDDMHKIRHTGNSHLAMAMTGEEGVVLFDLATRQTRNLFSFYDEALTFLGQYQTPQEADWQALANYLAAQYVEKVVKAGIQPTFTDSDAIPIHTIVTPVFFWTPESGKFSYFSRVDVVRERTLSGAVFRGFGIPGWPTGKDNKAFLMVFGRQEGYIPYVAKAVRYSRQVEDSESYAICGTTKIRRPVCLIFRRSQNR
jgi:hypothetical protein